ncbi:MAG TPA: hypothetical protein PLJ47_03435 [Candidatus Hydrogenedentes bacterium]|nr:hypothetical protein [Candidatus Hydrogenedentota bacterium]HRK33625.1 hypothetical protein [Candidatus Hydrogenedentota bacterium]
MIMADVFKILFIILGILITTVSYWLLFEALFRRAVKGASLAYEAHPYRVTIIGAVVAAPLFVAGLALLNSAAGLKLVGAILVSGLLLIGLLGSAGLARLVGMRLASATDQHYPWRRVLRGGIILSITFVLPIIGWFVVLPLTLVSGVGAIIVSRWGRRAPESVASPVSVANA